jgi:hypothetical protein
MNLKAGSKCAFRLGTRLGTQKKRDGVIFGTVGISGVGALVLPDPASARVPGGGALVTAMPSGRRRGPSGGGALVTVTPPGRRRPGRKRRKGLPQGEPSPLRPGALVLPDPAGAVGLRVAAPW